MIKNHKLKLPQNKRSQFVASFHFAIKETHSSKIVIDKRFVCVVVPLLSCVPNPVAYPVGFSREEVICSPAILQLRFSLCVVQMAVCSPFIIIVTVYMVFLLLAVRYLFFIEYLLLVYLFPVVCSLLRITSQAFATT